MYQFSGKTDNFDFFGPNSPKNEFWGRIFEILSLDSESAPPIYHDCQFSGKTNNFEFFSPNLPKNGFWSRNFEILSLDSESAPPIYHECQFSGKTDNFEFFGLNMGKLLNYVQYFGSYNVEGAAESWVETEMSWVKVDGAGWRCVHGLVIPMYFLVLTQKTEVNFEILQLRLLTSQRYYHIFC